MFVSILITTQKTQQIDDVVREFRQIQEPIRELEIRRSGSRGVYFVFKSDTIAPFQEFARTIREKVVGVKDGIEFAWDDGVFRQGFVSNGELILEEEFRSSHLCSAWIFLEHFTQVRDDMKRLLQAWEKETKPTPEQSKQKWAGLQEGKVMWERQLEEHSRRQKERSESLGNQTAIGKTQDSARPERRLPQTRREILDEVFRINASGSALIPLTVFPTELAKNLTSVGLGAFASYFDKSSQKAAMFELVKQAFKEYREQA
jgi:hypothetical protein